jgi:hypothetical protein
MGLDLTQFDTVSLSESGVSMELRHPGTGEVLKQPSGETVSITLAGPDSERCRAQAHLAGKKRAEIFTSGRKTLSNEELDREEVEMLAAMTIGWQGVSLSADGADLPCTKENAAEVYRRFPAFRQQAQRFVDARANFMKASPQS